MKRTRIKQAAAKSNTKELKIEVLECNKIKLQKTLDKKSLIFEKR